MGMESSDIVLRGVAEWSGVPLGDDSGLTQRIEMGETSRLQHEVGSGPSGRRPRKDCVEDADASDRLAQLFHIRNLAVLRQHLRLAEHAVDEVG